MTAGRPRAGWHPEVRTLHLLEGARAATGLVVVIDVFRAFTLAPCAVARGASRIRLVATPGEALALKAAEPGLVLAGERDGKPLPGFDFPNSPAAILGADLAGRTVVLRTSAGVQGLLAVDPACEVLAGSFINAAATVARIRARRPSRLSLVCMGWNGIERSAEDEACAAYLARAVAGDPPPFEPIRAALRRDPGGAKFFDPAQPWFPAEDFDVCLRLSALDFALRRVIDPEGRAWLEPVRASTDAEETRGAL
ncbi:2-phosphosulfolactate phosphatase [Thioalkalivibrio sp. XN8]|uniref:2-phosphosulfolactate phosphatase n=1 Tax=Thioalkalivibrio sp. XN8 TaxID=2712863 RepID=UPI0013ECA2B9|nr:2-phosphosulfolactate phosphatase [Thioalkalivibrio sp. XN8]NGP53837.1 2-phosphosulfolactate phosphatase [Thioalkalivibrio sp. XN8]